MYPVKFVKPYSVHPVGEITEIEKAEYKVLFPKGIVVDYDPSPKKAAAKKAEPAEPEPVVEAEFDEGKGPKRVQKPELGMPPKKQLKKKSSLFVPKE
jgi:hypothetical protein